VILDIPEFLNLRSALPVVDVRSENEFAEGHIQNAINIPILNNAERVEVGTTYKKLGQAEAIRSGFRLVGPRLADIITTSESIGKEFIVHCWRGGMRSGNYCQFVGMAGMKTHQLRGGYKAYRQFAERSFGEPLQLIIIAGYTGSGKSELLRTLANRGEQVIDLETLAHHKGSAFGGLGQLPQPTTEQFQNDLFESLHVLDKSKRIWIEDESIAVGKIFLPAALWRTMSTSPVIRMEVPKSVRVMRLVNEYGSADREAFLNALKGIIKKLGGQHYNAAAEFVRNGDMASAIDIILTYYDKAYLNGMSRKTDRTKMISEWAGGSLEKFAADLVAQADGLLKGNKNVMA
jgi:tRNA 2-selenouridine synthase